MCAVPSEESLTEALELPKKNAVELQQIVMQMFEQGGRPTGELIFEFVHGKTAVTTAYAR